MLIEVDSFLRLACTTYWEIFTPIQTGALARSLVIEVDVLLVLADQPAWNKRVHFHHQDASGLHGDEGPYHEEADKTYSALGKDNLLKTGNVI